MDFPPLVQSIYEVMYESLPSEYEINKFVMIFSPILKIVQLYIASTSYALARLQPFSRNIYIYGSLGAIARLLNFIFPFSQDYDKLKYLLKDLSFAFPLMGVIVAMGLDFLWALSSSTNSEILFRRNVSESDFVRKWESYQPFIVVFLACARYLPFNLEGVLITHASFNVWLLSSFGFIWFCLWKVAGASDTKMFRSAYKKSFAVTSFVTFAIICYNLSMVPCFYDVTLVRKFVLVTVVLETTSILLLVVFFAYFKAPPSDLQKQKANWTQVAGVMNARAAFKKATIKKAKKEM